MLDRPTRECKPSKRFEPSPPPTPSSTSANVGRRAPVRCTKTDRNTPVIKKEEAVNFTPDNATNDTRRRRGRGHGQIPVPRSESGRPVKRQKLKYGAQNSKDEVAGSSHSRLIKDDGEFDSLADSNASYIGGENEGLGKAPISRSCSKNYRKVPTLFIPNIRAEDEATIEQWYADPFERIDPTSPAYAELRRRNLEQQLTAHGWHAKRAKIVVNWLMHCNGRFRPLSDPPKCGRRKKAEPQTGSLEYPRNHSNRPDLDVGSCQSDDRLELEAIASVERELGIRSPHSPSTGVRKIGQLNRQSTPSRGPAKGQTRSPQRLAEGARTRVHQKCVGIDMSRTATTNAAMLRNSVENIKAGGESPEQHAVPSDPKFDVEKETEEIERQIAKTKRSLKIFDLVYGNDLPEPNYADLRIDHVSHVTELPRALPKQGIYTQGHNHLQVITLPENSEALSNHLINIAAEKNAVSKRYDGLTHNQTEAHNQEVLAEDPHLGLNPVLPSECYTAQEQKLLEKQALREKLRAEGDDDIRRAQEAAEDEYERAPVQAQLKRKVFEWENTHTMRGESADHND